MRCRQQAGAATTSEAHEVVEGRERRPQTAGGGTMLRRRGRAMAAAELATAVSATVATNSARVYREILAGREVRGVAGAVAAAAVKAVAEPRRSRGGAGCPRPHPRLASPSADPERHRCTRSKPH